MPQRPLYDLEGVDLNRTQHDRDAIARVNPQRFEFEQLDHVALFDREEKVAIGVRDLKEDEFWTRGHMPGRPIFPGVLMLESAAQLCSFYTQQVLDEDLLYGFGGADRVRFRRMVGVGDRFVLIARPETITTRRSVFKTQGLVDGKIAFEAEILGIALPDQQS